MRCLVSVRPPLASERWCGSRRCCAAACVLQVAAMGLANTSASRGGGFQKGLRYSIICLNFCSLGVMVFKMLFDQNPAGVLFADQCSWPRSESWGWPCCILEQGPDVLITPHVMLPSDCSLWSGYYEKKKQPPNFFTNGLLDLNLLPFPPKNLSVLLIWSVIIIRFYCCISLQQCHLSGTQICFRAKLLSSYLHMQEEFSEWGHWNSSCQLGDRSLLVQFSQSLTANHRSDSTWVWHEHISVELLKAHSVGFVLALCFHGG